MQDKQASTVILILYTLLFVTITVVSLIRSEDYWVDGLTAVIGCLVFLLLNYKYPVHPVIAVLEASIFIPNQLGFAFLYNVQALNYHGDWIIHFVASAIVVIVFMYYLRKINCIKHRIILIMTLSFALAVAGGAIIEVVEYWGFIFFGFNNSYLGFGAGDNSQNFGPWENASLDVTFNILGILLGLAIYYFYIHSQKKKSRRTHQIY